MQTFLMYDPATGAVRGRCGNEPEDAEASKLPGTTLLPIPPGHPAATEYDYTAFHVTGGAALRRQAPPITLTPQSIAADGLAEVTVTGIPEGSKLTVSGPVDASSMVITGGSLTLTASEPGEVRLVFDCPAPFARWEGTVHAT